MRDLEDWFVALAAACLAAGWRVAAFTNGSSEDESFLAQLAPRLAALSPAGAASVVPRFADPRALAEFVAGLDLLMAHRLHANIAAYAYGVPQIGFAWDVKLKSFLERVDRADCLATAGRDPVDGVVALAARQLESGVDPARRTAAVGEARDSVAALGQALMDGIARNRRRAAAARPPRASAPRRAERLVIVNDFSVARGGATALALLEAELFARRGLPITFIAGDAADNPDLQQLGVSMVGSGSSGCSRPGSRRRRCVASTIAAR